MLTSDILTDLGALNAHARGCGGALARAIYAYKEAATFALLAENKLKVRPTRWRGPCGACGGDGVFKYWEGGTGACRSCVKGTVTLRFAEVTLPDGQVWHHPWSTPHGGMTGYELLRVTLASAIGADWYDKVDWFEPLDWKPRLPAKKIDGEDLVERLNRVETWVLAADVYGELWRSRISRDRMVRYALCVTHRIPEHCWVCHRADDMEAVKVGSSGTWPLTWSARVCKEHWLARKGGEVQWPSEFPASGMTPAIALWVSRRPEKRLHDYWDWA